MQSGYRLITSTNNALSGSPVAAPSANYIVASRPVQGPAGVTYVQPAAEAAQLVVINQLPRTREIYVTTPQLQPNTAATAVQMVQLVPVTEQAYSTSAPQQQNNGSVGVYVLEAKTLNPTGRHFYER